MKQVIKGVVFGVALPLMLLGDFSPGSLLGLGLIREAAAIVGAPLTPGSVAGVARRTTRRAVVVTSSAAAAESQQQQATAQQQQATAQQQAATAQQQQATAQQQAAVAQQQSQGAPAIGTVVPTLPAGCVANQKDGVAYHKCGSVTYRAAFQGNNLVYVVQ